MTDAVVDDLTTLTPVAVDGGVLYIEATRLPGAPGAEHKEWSEDEEVAGTVPDLSEVMATLSGFATQITHALRQARPDKFTVEFGCELGIEPSGITLLIAKGSLKSTLKVSLEWTA